MPDALRTLDPDLEVGRTRGPHPQGPAALGWVAPAGTGWAYTLACFATLVLLALSPEPRRVTPWGWFWLILLTGPVGSLAFLALSGVLSARPVARPARPRTGGGWAFVLALVLGNVLGVLE
ncbi:hypothetical protein [Nocardioides sp. zg-DK7169]|uniref:hypothetical protein n=1 Tax=Nocardioides sp. zg-DK7169 TaxID=2736600 RepID=UPI001556934F|nr:hypothetical protein [Nocardioides sp. zg-DK7169]NPC98980.1 hypothetical protein [Nocardioides sp. zg-DK7169]